MRIAGLEDRVAPVRAAALEVAGGSDPRQTGAYDQHVNVFGNRGTHAYQGSIQAGPGRPRKLSGA